MTALLIFSLLAALLATGMPVSIALGLTVLAFLFFMTDVSPDIVALKLFTGLEKFEIMAVPFFILAGAFLTHGGVARRMIRFAVACVGHWPGGLAIAGVFAAAIFAAVSGSSAATVAAIGGILVPAMVRQGYPAAFGAGAIASAGALGILIPPSIVMVLYAVATAGMQASGPDGRKVASAAIDDLFMAGVVPGILLALLLGVVTWAIAAKRDYPRNEPATWGEAGRAFLDCFWGLALIVLVLGGIYAGLYTATEAAAMSAVYAFVIAVYVYRDMTLREVPQVLLEAGNMSAMILYIIANAMLFSFLLTHEQIPQAIAEWLIAQGLGPAGFMTVVCLLLLAAGMVMEPASITLILAPILFPVAAKLGIHPVHFGIVIVVTMEIGMITPPVGLNLYVASSMSKLGLTAMSRAVTPWLVAMVAFLVLVVAVPELSLALPRALGML